MIRTAGGIPPGSNQVQNPVIQRRLANVFDVKERSIAPSVASEIVPTVLIEDATEPAFSRDLWNVRDCSFGTLLANGGAAFWESQFENPAASGMIIEIRKIILVSTSGGPGFTLHASTASFIGAGQQGTFWNRAAIQKQGLDPVTALPCALIARRTDGLGIAVANVLYSGSIDSGGFSTYLEPLKIVLGPGQFLHTQIGTAGTATIRQTWFWRERNILN